MKFHSTPLTGAFVMEPERNSDDRGFFARLFCEREFQEASLNVRFVQVNNSLSLVRGTLRGLHYQLPPAAEVKVIRCLRGGIYDLILDLRPDSPTYGKCFGERLDSDNRLMMYVPRGFAHATLSLTDDTEILYLVSEFHNAEVERGVRFDDPRFSIKWPVEPVVISKKDREWRDFDPVWHGVDQLKGLS